ncbi:type II secretion system secretin GspD [Bradyrhizobium sp. AUGA SZCCT0051]|nr:type II secretion system secretin GspD [Bradyrhizobium sp. AUGA SZCCT0124]MBR1311580.1 type II secretion system secretin GspD [Bradyrhizobium sp. AUGA SZCCT0051]MBR1338800.1 type II secretion system secretin GspD [Bradyrhizobium sp. AUGA SZCCT0105]MBR1353374.1 type II secretion system secretin GspD [Bradyrhizobium sp. AUGA SZCCT0045]
MQALPLALWLSGCQTVEDRSAIAERAYASTPASAKGHSRAEPSSEEPGGTLLLSNPRGGRSTIIEGSGRFVGEPPTGSINPASEDVTDGVTINLVSVPAPQAAKTILGDILAVKYTVDPGIEGKITIQTPKPVAKSSVIDLFQAALRSNNAAMVNNKGIYRIVAADQTAVGSSFRTDDAPDTEMIGSGLQVVQLKYVSASEIRRVLETIAPKDGIVRVDDARNLITLAGNRQDIAAMMDAIALFDIDTMKGMSFAIVPVKTSQPDAIAGELKTVFAAERDGPMAGMVRFVPNKRLGAILVISPQAEYLRRAETWIRRLDAQAQGSEKELFTYSVQNRRAQELVDVLQSMFSNEVTGTATAKRNVAPNYQEASVQSTQPQQSQGFGSQASSGVTGSIGSGGGGFGSGGTIRAPATQTASPGSSGTAVQLGKEGDTDGPRVKIVADEAKNAILVEATKADYQRILRVMGRLDRMPNQVMIEATIAEVTLNDDLKFGVRWYMQQKSAGYTFSDAASGAIGSVFPGFSYALTAANVAATLNTLSDITKVNVISSPSLTVMDNKPAVLQIGDQVPITTQSAAGVITPGAPIVNSVSYKDTGVILSIIPRINESGRVLLDIQQEVSNVAQTTTSNIDSPTIRQRRIQTSVVVNDNDALVLGGMIQDERTTARTQIPILGDIPFIGNLASNKDNLIHKTELIILIRPHVVRNLDEARSITDDYRRYMAIEGPHKRRQSRQSPEEVGRRILD